MPIDSTNIEEKAVHSRYAQNSELLLAPTVIPSVTNFNQSQKPDLAAEKPVCTSQQLSADLPGRAGKSAGTWEPSSQKGF